MKIRLTHCEGTSFGAQGVQAGVGVVVVLELFGEPDDGVALPLHERQVDLGSQGGVGELETGHVENPVLRGDRRFREKTFGRLSSAHILLPESQCARLAVKGEDVL